MLNLIQKTIRATIIYLIVALIVMIAIITTLHLSLGPRINEFISIVNKVSIGVVKHEQEPSVMTEKKRLKNYPEYGSEYAKIEIPKIDVDLPVFFGDTLEVLKNGVGHSSGSFFPGEGGSIVYMGHNSKKIFRRFSELQRGDEIIVTTNYGKYKYKIYDMKIINETDVDQIPIQDEKEILMIYTCYPLNNIGYATQRYVVYSELEI